MPYDETFYETYKSYLLEPTVRKAHDWMFHVALIEPRFNDVLDLGCGAFNEFLVYAKPENYIGIDIGASSAATNGRIIRGDYRDVETLTALVRPNTPTAFVSLFSTEITAPFKENYALYENIFKSIPSIKAGLVSGFYYVSKKEQNPIGETGGIQSYQTLECIEEAHSTLFEERRMILPVPSRMFGQDVFEIWKFFEKQG
jgi:hypothetical protein